MSHRIELSDKATNLFISLKGAYSKSNGGKGQAAAKAVAQAATQAAAQALAKAAKAAKAAAEAAVEAARMMGAAPAAAPAAAVRPASGRGHTCTAPTPSCVVGSCTRTSAATF